MSRKAWLLFLATSVIWGSSFLLIKVAVRDMSPASVVFGRMLFGAAICLPLAFRRRSLSGLGRCLPAIIAVTCLDMALPTFLTAWGEQRVSSSLAGILTATDPLFVAVLAFWVARSERVDRRRFAGLLIGFAGVAVLLGFDSGDGHGVLSGSAAVIMSAACYALAALIYRRWLTDAPALGVTALTLSLSSVVFAGPGIAGLTRATAMTSTVAAVVVLGVVNTGLAYWMFYVLVDEAGAASASVITYAMPVVALILGVAVLGEQLTVSIIAGLVLIACGAWLATARNQKTAA